MYARNVALHLKPNTLSDFRKTFDSNVLPILRKQKGFQDEIMFAIPGLLRRPGQRGEAAATGRLRAHLCREVKRKRLTSCRSTSSNAGCASCTPTRRSHSTIWKTKTRCYSRSPRSSGSMTKDSRQNGTCPSRGRT
jgi:hypothetical protein